MASRAISVPNNSVLAATGVGLLLLGAFAAWQAAMAVPASMPTGAWVAVHSTRDALLGAALLFVAVGKRRSAGAVAVIVATVLLVGTIGGAALAVVWGTAFHPGWHGVVDLAIAALIAGPIVAHARGEERRAVLFWMGATVGVVLLISVAVAIMARG